MPTRVENRVTKNPKSYWANESFDRVFVHKYRRIVACVILDHIINFPYQKNDHGLIEVMDSNLELPLDSGAYYWFNEYRIFFKII